jgi:hypothetical protein
MTMFDDRERAYEAKFRLDEEAAFRIAVRRDKLLGLWAGAMMGMDADAAKAYAKALMDSDLEHHDVIHKLKTDLCTSGVPVDEATVQTYLHEFHEKAREQIIAELALK